MSDWEEFCDAKGWNIGSDADYDKFLGSLEDKPVRRTFGSRPVPSNHEALYFSTFAEAKQWAMTNVGQAFTRSSDGLGFIPKQKDSHRR